MIKMGSIRFTNVNKLVDDLVVHVSKGIISFSLLIQRGYVWDASRKSAFILNLIEGGPTFPIYVNKVDGVDYVIDGQQRLRTTSSFIENKFSLSKLPQIEMPSGEIVDISGCKFDKLKKPIQDAILRYSFAYNYGENLTDEQVRTVYIRLNSGRPLSATEMTKAQIKSISEVKRLAQHDAFKKFINEKGLEASKSDDIVMQIYTVLFERGVDLLASKIRKSLMYKDITSEEQMIITKCLDGYDAVFINLSEDNCYEAKRAVTFLGKKTHMVSFIYCINQCIEKGALNTQLLTDWIKYFFNGEIDKTSISKEYNDLLLGGTNTRVSVDQRHQLMYQSFLEYESKNNRLGD